MGHYVPTPMHLRKPIPATVRWKVLLRARWNCEDCHNNRHIELHHLRYFDDNNQIIFGQEQETDISVLCRACHESRHYDSDGKFWADPEAMARAWRNKIAEVV